MSSRRLSSAEATQGLFGAGYRRTVAIWRGYRRTVAVWRYRVQTPAARGRRRSGRTVP